MNGPIFFDMTWNAEKQRLHKLFYCWAYFSPAGTRLPSRSLDTIGEAHRYGDRWQVFQKNAVEIGLPAVTQMPSIITTGTRIKKLTEREEAASAFAFS
jgi:hypothetical protein